MPFFLSLPGRLCLEKAVKPSVTHLPDAQVQHDDHAPTLLIFTVLT